MNTCCKRNVQRGNGKIHLMRIGLGMKLFPLKADVCSSCHAQVSHCVIKAAMEDDTSTNERGRIWPAFLVAVVC